ncbi:MAG: DNA translocase FtsK, partial [Planctomycetota bacterium]
EEEEPPLEEPEPGEEEEIAEAAETPPEPARAPVFPALQAEADEERAAPKRRGGDPPLPPIELLERGKPIDVARLEETIQRNAEILEKTLASFKLEARVVGYTRGPVITMYELALKEGTKLSQIVNLSDDLAIALKAESVRIVAPIPGKNTVGAEVPNLLRDDVRLHGLACEHAAERDRMAIPLFLGRDASGRAMIDDLTTMPHLLIAGATGSGKSVCINSIILSILLTRRREDVQLILIDPKQVELAFFREIPHLLTAVVTDARKAAQTLDWVISEMEDRYWIFARFGVRNIAAYNRLGARSVRQLAKEHDIGDEKAPARLPYLVVVVDELADLIMTGRKEVEQAVTRLAQKSRAVGIHAVLATQRPSTDVITGLIKANMPCRAAFKVTSKVDSRVVLDQNGSEKLLGRGDMLFLPPRSFHLVRCQGTFVADSEVKSVVDFLKANAPKPELRELVVRPETLDQRDPNEVDDLFDTACRVVLESQRGSASLLQRALQIGYTRASRLVDLMRSQGIIGEFKNAQAAEVLLTLEEYERRFPKPSAP